MTDREKVIDDLEEQIVWIRDNDFHKFPGWVHAVLAMRDALALLKAQEPVKPYMDYDGHDVWLCGNCHRKIFHPSHTEADNDEKNYRKFCFHCGRAVKWE